MLLPNSLGTLGGIIGTLDGSIGTVGGCGIGVVRLGQPGYPAVTPSLCP